MALNSYLVDCLVVLLVVGWFVVRSRKHRFPLPPGPKRWPLIGNISDIPPSEEAYLAFREWRDTYGKPYSASQKAKSEYDAQATWYIPRH